MLWYIYIYEKTLMKKKELITCSKDLDNLNYGLLEKNRGVTKSPIFSLCIFSFLSCFALASTEWPPAPHDDVYYLTKVGQKKISG